MPSYPGSSLTTTGATPLVARLNICVDTPEVMIRAGPTPLPPTHASETTVADISSASGPQTDSQEERSALGGRLSGRRRSSSNFWTTSAPSTSGRRRASSGSSSLHRRRTSSPRRRAAGATTTADPGRRRAPVAAGRRRTPYTPSPRRRELLCARYFLMSKQEHASPRTSVLYCRTY